jgi:hypothetical protein
MNGGFLTNEQQACVNANIQSSPGKFGTLGWIDRTKNYWGLITTFNTANPLTFTLSMQANDDLRPVILNILV